MSNDPTEKEQRRDAAPTVNVAGGIPDAYRKTKLVAWAAPPAPEQADDCLIAIYSADPRVFGKLHILRDEPLTIGRAGENRFVLGNDEVSRRHCRVEKRGATWHIVDLHSTNGTYVNAQRVTECALCRDDQIKIGDTILKFLSGSDLEAQYHEAIYNMTIVDGLTGLSNKRCLVEALERELPRARRHDRPLSVVMLDIDHFKTINDNYGSSCGDFVLQELATLVKARGRPDDISARFGGDEFCMLLPDTAVQSAAVLAEEMRHVVEHHRFAFEDEVVPCTISIGCVEASEHLDTGSALQAVDNMLYRAKREGRNRIAFEGHADRPLRRTLEGATVVHRSLAAEGASWLVGFEIDDEIAIMAQLGRQTRDAWLRDLERVVDELLEPPGLLGMWQNRYIVASVRGSQRADAFASQVRSRWEGEAPVSPRRLRVAWMGPDELREHELAVLERLALKLLESRSVSTQGMFSTLPFPLAASAAWVASTTSELHRLAALVHAIEVHLQLGVAISLALLDPGRVSDDVAARLRTSTNKPLTMGHWRELVDAASGGVSQDLRHPAVRWLGQLRAKVKLRGSRAPLIEHVNKSVGVRNRTVGHGTPMPEHAYSEDVSYLQEVLDALMKAAEPLSGTHLVSVAGADVLADEDEIAYELRDHTGPSEIFPVRSERISARLGRGWAYLMTQNWPPISLAPVVACLTCKECMRTEIFLADGLIFGPKGAIVDSSGVTTNHKAQIQVQWTTHARALHDRCSGA